MYLILVVVTLLVMLGAGAQGANPMDFRLEVKGMKAFMKAEEEKGHRNAAVLSLAPGKPLELRLSVVNSSGQAREGKIAVRVLTLSWQQLWRRTWDHSFPPGRTEITYKLFDEPGDPPEGTFLAQVLSTSNGKKLAELVFSYFPSVPDIPHEDDAPILIFRRDRNVVGKIPAKRSWPKVPGIPDKNIMILAQTQTSDGRIYGILRGTPPQAFVLD